MLKRFLKFLRGDEESGESSPFEGSYLDHLFVQIQPEVVRSLERCPENDPVLLVVAGILRHTMMSVFHPSVDEPLLDAYSPGMVPPPPPVELDASSETGEFDRAFDDGWDDEEEESEAEAIETVDDESIVESEESAEIEVVADADEPDASDDEASDEDEEDSAEESSESEEEEEESDGSEDEEADASSDESTEEEIPDEIESGPKRITEKFDTSEIQKATSSDESTGEIEIRIGNTDPDITAELTREELDDRPRIDTPQTLASGRTFLHILIENDTLAPDLQLSIADLMIVRDHLLRRDDDVDHGKKLLTLVERKFNDAFFGQARLLLTLFPTDDLTALNNDRNIFYEEMILKLGIKRRHRMSDEDLELYDNLVAHIGEHGVQPLLNWFRTESGVKFHVRRIDDDHVQTWTEISSMSNRPDVSDYLLNLMPRPRWRELHEDDDPRKIVVDALDFGEAQEHIKSLIATCYFVLRAVGDTGLEPFLDTFFNWTRETFDFNGTALMPVLHRRAMTDVVSMHHIVDDLFHQHFAASLESKLEAWDREEVETAMHSVFSRMSGPKLGEIAPGDYNLTAFILDELLGIEYPDPDFPFKIHRLT